MDHLRARLAVSFLAICVAWSACSGGSDTGADDESITSDGSTFVSNNDVATWTAPDAGGPQGDTTAPLDGGSPHDGVTTPADGAAPVVCEPSCEDRVCGEDNCGGLCGECLEEELCSWAGLCLDAASCTDTCELTGVTCGTICGEVCGVCADNEICTDGACYAPGPGPGPGGPAPGEFLHPCDGNDDCFSGYCIDSPEGDVCSKTCEDDDSCLDGWSCTSITEGGDPTFICVPDDTFLCRPCEADADCNIPGYPATGVCVEVGVQGSFCTRKCGDETACPNQFTCQELYPYGEAGPMLNLCAADSPDACTCTSKFVNEHATTACKHENEFGTCVGQTMCVEVGPLPACSAPEPIAELCNGVDDDCDGFTDEDAEDCTQYYLDSDGDGYGLGYGECFCEDPGGAWLLQGGDCNELIMSINPGAQEVCGNFEDDDCDGTVNEEDALGCVIHYFDQDGDGYGVDDTTACLCDGTEGWAPESGDCNDLNPGANPGVSEVCDTIDNDCNGKIDEEGAINCLPFWHDSDGDGYGLTDQFKCLCGPTGVFIGNKDNDCDDTTTAVNPGVPELCNGVDDNCDGNTDEGDSASMCPQVASGLAECVDGTCALTSCEDGWSDADGDPLNGCECPIGQLEVPGGPGETCLEPQDLGVLADSGASTQVTDNIAPATDEDWYKITALDGADPNSCDTFDVRISFIHNPQGRFAFDVFEGGCASGQEICKTVDLYTNTTNISTQIGDSPVGECPCGVPQEPPNNDSEDDGMSEGLQHCSDNTNVYLVRVYRRDTFEPSCAAYTLALSNGPL